MKALVSDVATPISRHVEVKEHDSIIDFFNALLRSHDADYGFVVNAQGRLKGIVTPIQLLDFCEVRLASGAEEMSSRELMKYLDAKDVNIIPAVSVRPSDNVSARAANLTLTSLATVSAWVIPTVGLAFIVPRLIHRSDQWEQEGVIETVSTSLLFILAAMVSFAGFSPILGAFALGWLLQVLGRSQELRNTQTKSG